ncbi:MAG: GNAT family N-acetyltransferase [Candidatus Kariarchaeaceae archaeon]
MSETVERVLQKAKFRKIREKERVKFYEYAMEETADTINALGISFNFIKKLCRINRILLGIPVRIMMKSSEDIVYASSNKIFAGYTLFYNKEKDSFAFGNLFTRPKYQRRGIAHKVMKQIIQSCDGKKISLEVDSKNANAIHLYKKHSFDISAEIKEFVGTLPLNAPDFPDGYSSRPAQKGDLESLDLLQNKLNQFKNLQQTYKKSFNKTKAKRFRMENQFPVVLLRNNEIVGIGRARWGKATPETAQISLNAVLPEAQEAYPSLFSYLTREIHCFGLKKYIWLMDENNKSFHHEMLPYLSEPFRCGLKMERVPT